MFAPMCRQAHIIRRSRHHWQSQHHLPKANIIQKTQLPSPLLYHKIDNTSNEASPCGDMMHLLRKNDVAPLCSAMMRCLPQCAVRHTSFAKRTSLGVAVIICRRQTSFKKRTFVLVDKSAFFAGRGWRT